MRLLDENYQEIQEQDIDLTKGFVYGATIIRPDAQPLGGDKTVWADEDYEQVRMYHAYTPEELALMSEPTPEDRIAELEAALELLLSGVTE